MTTPYEAYNRGAIALAEHFDIGRVPASDFVLDHNPYPKDENAGWTLFKPSDDLDYEALDGREAKLVHKDGAELTFTMHRDILRLPADMPSGWAAPKHTGVAFLAGWHGDDGWKLYIKGDLPTKRVTADTLEPGTGFAGVAPNGSSYHSLIRIISAQGKPLVLSTSSIEYFKAKEVEVSEVYGIGTFQKPTKEGA